MSTDFELAPVPPTGAIDDATREQARMLGIGRAAVGGLMILAPATSMRVWLGEGRNSPGARLATRALGAREVALGAGLMLAADKGTPIRGWLEAGVLCDAADTFLTLTSYKKLPRLGRTLVLLVAAGAAVNGARLAQRQG